MLTILASLFWGIVVGLLARRKNLSSWNWGMAGAVSWFIALVFLAFQPYRCAKCKRVVDNNQMTNTGCVGCMGDTSLQERIGGREASEPSIAKTILLPLLVLAAIAAAVIFAIKPAGRTAIRQEPLGVVARPNSSSASAAESTITMKKPEALISEQLIFITSPESDIPCKAIPGIHTVDDGIKYFYEKYENRAVQMNNVRSINSTGQRVAVLELQTENAPIMFALMDGTIKQCNEFFDATKLSIKNQHHQANPGHPEEWVRVGATLNGARTDYTDISSVMQGDDGLTRLTVKQKFDPPQISPSGSEIAETRFSVVLNCKENASAVSLMKQYDKDNNLLEHIESDNLRWIAAAETENSLTGTLLRSHCKRISVRP